MKKILTIDDITLLGPVLYQNRTEQGLTVKEISRRTGLHVNTIWRIERGEGIPRLDVIRLWCKALGYSEIKITVK